MTDEEAIQAVRQAVASCLQAPLEDVTLQSRLVDDLGMDSLDFVDLVFLLEGSFGVELQGSELDNLTRLDPSSDEVMRGDYLALAVVEKAKPWVPALADVPDAELVTPAELFGMVTVESIWTVMKRVVARGGRPA